MGNDNPVEDVASVASTLACFGVFHFDRSISPRSNEMCDDKTNNDDSTTIAVNATNIRPEAKDLSLPLLPLSTSKITLDPSEEISSGRALKQMESYLASELRKLLKESQSQAQSKDAPLRSRENMENSKNSGKSKKNKNNSKRIKNPNTENSSRPDILLENGNTNATSRPSTTNRSSGNSESSVNCRSRKVIGDDSTKEPDNRIPGVKVDNAYYDQRNRSDNVSVNSSGSKRKTETVRSMGEIFQQNVAYSIVSSSTNNDIKDKNPKNDKKVKSIKKYNTKKKCSTGTSHSAVQHTPSITSPNDTEINATFSLVSDQDQTKNLEQKLRQNFLQFSKLQSLQDENIVSQLTNSRTLHSASSMATITEQDYNDDDEVQSDKSKKKRKVANKHQCDVNTSTESSSLKRHSQQPQTILSSTPTKSAATNATLITESEQQNSRLLKMLLQQQMHQSSSSVEVMGAQVQATVGSVLPDQKIDTHDDPSFKSNSANQHQLTYDRQLIIRMMQQQGYGSSPSANMLANTLANTLANASVSSNRSTSTSNIINNHQEDITRHYERMLHLQTHRLPEGEQQNRDTMALGEKHRLQKVKTEHSTINEVESQNNAAMILAQHQAVQHKLMMLQQDQLLMQSKHLTRPATSITNNNNNGLLPLLSSPQGAAELSSSYYLATQLQKLHQQQLLQSLHSTHNQEQIQLLLRQLILQQQKEQKQKMELQLQLQVQLQLQREQLQRFSAVNRDSTNETNIRS